MAERILVPVEGSETMERTIRYACDLAKMLDGTLTLIHIVALPVPIEPNMSVDPTPLEEAGERILNGAQKLAEENGCKAERIQEIGVGNVGYKITKVASEKGFTLIVIHARGHTRVSTLLLGRVCHAVAHTSPCPVLIVRP